ncbi:MAG: homoaconitate hydratase [Bacteroides sp. SM23_62_1]|nr:MAG: homoaconitate hydratase [Bacteroides sp. SM23_62_1]
MGQTMIEKILAMHSDRKIVHPGEVINVRIDTRVARDFGGANVVKHLRDKSLGINDSSRTFFTFDCNPTGSDQKYAENQHICRIFAREHGIKVFDINRGIGTHILIDEGLVFPGATAVSTDSHANLLGAIGAFGQGMGDLDIAAIWNSGKTWFRIPDSVKIILNGAFQPGLNAKDIILNLLARFGANRLLGCSVEITGEAVLKLSVDERITIASMATEMGALTILFEPNLDVIRYCESRVCQKIDPVVPDRDAIYSEIFEIQASEFIPMISRPGKPHDAVAVNEVKGTKIDSAFIGSCTNGRLKDLRITAEILKNRKVAPGVILKIVPSTDKIWNLCLEEGLFEIFKDARAMVSNAGCAGCAAGQVGQNGPGEVTISSGNRNFPGKQGKGDVYLASPPVIAASAIAGYITTPDDIPDKPAVYITPKKKITKSSEKTIHVKEKPKVIKGKVWYIDQDNIDTDMIFHNQYLAVTNLEEMGKYTFSNLKGYEDFAKKAKTGDIILAGRNFGAGSSRQQAVDCFRSLGIQCIIAESFGAIYERNAINAAFPILSGPTLKDLEIKQGDILEVNFMSGDIINMRNKKKIQGSAFSEVQMEIYQKGGLF